MLNLRAYLFHLEYDQNKGLFLDWHLGFFNNTFILSLDKHFVLAT